MVPYHNETVIVPCLIIVIQLMKYYSTSPHLTLMIHVGWVKLAMKLPYWGKDHPTILGYRLGTTSEALRLQGAGMCPGSFVEASAVEAVRKKKGPLVTV